MSSGPDVDVFAPKLSRWTVPDRSTPTFPDLDHAGLRDRLVDAVRATGAQQVLEVGCGDGTLTRLLVDAGCKVVAVDSRADALGDIELSDSDVTRYHWDLHQPLGFDVLRTQDLVVGAYLLHEFVFDRQVDLMRRWAAGSRLGIAMIADIGFPNAEAFDAARRDLAGQWSERHTYLSGATITSELETLGLRARWDQVTPSAGILHAQR